MSKFKKKIQIQKKVGRFLRKIDGLCHTPSKIEEMLDKIEKNFDFSILGIAKSLNFRITSLVCACFGGL